MSSPASSALFPPLSFRPFHFFSSSFSASSMRYHPPIISHSLFNFCSPSSSKLFSALASYSVCLPRPYHVYRCSSSSLPLLFPAGAFLLLSDLFLLLFFAVCLRSPRSSSISSLLSLPFFLCSLLRFPSPRTLVDSISTEVCSPVYHGLIT